jgi:hypothetical protein
MARALVMAYRKGLTFALGFFLTSQKAEVRTQESESRAFFRLFYGEVGY